MIALWAVYEFDEGVGGKGRRGGDCMGKIDGVRGVGWWFYADFDRGIGKGDGKCGDGMLW